VIRCRYGPDEHIWRRRGYFHARTSNPASEYASEQVLMHWMGLQLVADCSLSGCAHAGYPRPSDRQAIPNIVHRCVQKRQTSIRCIQASRATHPCRSARNISEPHCSHAFEHLIIHR
jgi:hypothetical protein